MSTIKKTSSAKNAKRGATGGKQTATTRASSDRKTAAPKAAPVRRKPQAAVRATPRTRVARASTPPGSEQTPPAHEATPPTHEQISARAYELFEQSGYRHGAELEHWLQAEAELVAPQPRA